jgi:ABC-type transport system substrate-binding protein
MMVTQSFFFNTNNPIFADAKVRRALSLALDREHIADLLTFASPAVGVVPEGAFNTTYKTDFREEGEDLIKSTAELGTAKDLIKEAKPAEKSFTITVRDNEADKAVAEYAKEQWKEIGFTVKIKTLKNDHVIYLDRSTDTEFEYVVDSFQEAYVSGDFDVILVDMNMYSPDPFNALAQFAADFSGNGIDMMSEDYKTNLHVTGYNNPAYVEIIEKAYAATDAKERANLLHEAEKLLVDDMPICPIVTLQSAYISSKILSGIKTTYYGTTDFRRMKMKNYMDYKEDENAPATESVEEE